MTVDEDVVWVSGPAVWQALGTAQIGGSSDVRPLLSSSYASGGAAMANTILGRPHYVTSSTGMAGGTAADVLLYNLQELAVVFAQRYTVLFDKTTRAESDETRIIASARIGLKPIHTAAIARLSNVNTTWPKARQGRA